MKPREKVLAWLQLIGENDDAIIAETIRLCKEDKEYRAFCVAQYHELEGVEL